MLSFRVHRFHIGELHYLLLPKMTRAQMGMISDRLKGAGYTVELSGSLLAKSGQGAIRVDPSGVCRSSADVADLIVPAIPGILAADKERAPIAELESLYFTTGRFGAKARLRVSTRVESFLLWDLMRAADGCGLSPDEHEVVSFLLGHAKGATRMVTDFPEEGSRVRVLGRRRYFDSEIDPTTAASTLRIVGAKARKNSYLRRDGSVEFATFKRPSAADRLGLFSGLGEWCYFLPE